jgi:hypothetical protein
LSIVFRLAGNPEYSQGRVASYTKAVDEHFQPYKDHAVVRHARRLRGARGIGFDAVAGFAVHLDGSRAQSTPATCSARPPALPTSERSPGSLVCRRVISWRRRLAAADALRATAWLDDRGHHGPARDEARQAWLTYVEGLAAILPMFSFQEG